MITNSYYSQEVHGPYALYEIGDLELEEGGTIRNCQLAYVTFGTLNAAKDNAILFPTWYSGTWDQQDHRAGIYRQRARARPRQVFHHRC